MCDDLYWPTADIVWVTDGSVGKRASLYSALTRTFIQFLEGFDNVIVSLMSKRYSIRFTSLCFCDLGYS
jgi:hypothetical protein